MLKQNTSSGGRRSSDGTSNVAQTYCGRRSSDGTSDVAQTYCSSYGWASAAPRTGRNLVAVTVKVFGACFGLKIERSTNEEPVKNFKSPSCCCFTQQKCSSISRLVRLLKGKEKTLTERDYRTKSEHLLFFWEPKVYIYDLNYGKARNFLVWYKLMIFIVFSIFFYSGLIFIYIFLLSGCHSNRQLVTATLLSRSPSNRRPVASKRIWTAFSACRLPPPDLSILGSGSLPTFSGSSHGGSPGSRMRNSSRGLYATGSNPSQRQPGNKKFTLQEISKATENFCSSLKIGEGGFGTVYKGNLDDGTLVAVKRAKKAVLDNCRNLEFQTEIKTLALVEHFNLARFIGYVEQDGEKALVVEYVPNGTLREHLDCLQGKPLDFAARLDIAIDIAHAVTYLHMYADHPIIHRDIKSSNVLLTETLRAKVTDFGFARFGMNEGEASYISTQVKGTAGYLDPEYIKTYQLTEKSDVFSFGVLLVELISGRRPIEPKRDRKETITAKWAIKNFSEGNAKETLDPNLPASPSTNFALEKILELALQCMAPTRKNRPSMRRCAEIMWRIRKYYRELFNSEPSSVPSQWRNASCNGRMEHHHLSSKSKNEKSKSCSVQSSR